MKLKIGDLFWCGEKLYKCTDIGTRTIIAIRIDKVKSISNRCKKVLSYEEAKAEGWLNGPPYALEEIVFDEFDLPWVECSTFTLEPSIKEAESHQALVPTREQLYDFYRAIAKLTINHDSVGPYAVVFPNKLGEELEKVIPEWYSLD